MHKRLISLVFLSAFCFCTFFLAFAQAGELSYTVEPFVMEMGDNRIAYPQLKNLNNEAVMSKINSDIIVSGNISSHIVTLTSLSQDSPWGLQVSYEVYQSENVFSVVIHALGKQPQGRNGHSSKAMTYDLSTGERLTLDQLFHDPAGAVFAMEQKAETSLGSEMVEYMSSNQITPLPVDNFFVSPNGITFYYPAEQFSYISGYSGACHFFPEEIGEYFLSAPDSFPALMGMLPLAYSDGDAKAAVEACAASGSFPSINVKLGDKMPDILSYGRLVREPDVFPGGRYFLLESPEFRDVYLISDNMQSGYDHSVLKGIQLRRGGVGGFVIGKTQREDWLRILGQPSQTVAFTENMAYDYQLPVGQSDIYSYGKTMLRFHSDENGILFAIQLYQ